MSMHFVHNEHNELAMYSQWIHIEECVTTSQRLQNDFATIPQYLSNAIAYQFAMGSHFVRDRVCTGTLRKSRAIWQHVSACLGGGGLSGPRRAPSGWRKTRGVCWQTSGKSIPLVSILSTFTRMRVFILCVYTSDERMLKVSSSIEKNIMFQRDHG